MLVRDYVFDIVRDLVESSLVYELFYSLFEVFIDAVYWMLWFRKAYTKS